MTEWNEISGLIGKDIASLIEREGKMNNLVIKADKYTIYQINKNDVQKLKHITERDYEGFWCAGLTTNYKPIHHQKEEWYVIMTNGKRINLTKKQYKIVKGWFDND